MCTAAQSEQPMCIATYLPSPCSCFSLKPLLSRASLSATSVGRRRKGFGGRLGRRGKAGEVFQFLLLLFFLLLLLKLHWGQWCAARRTQPRLRRWGGGRATRGRDSSGGGKNGRGCGNFGRNGPGIDRDGPGNCNRLFGGIGCDWGQAQLLARAVRGGGG
jgi:hypothetical protein